MVRSKRNGWSFALAALAVFVLALSHFAWVNSAEAAYARDGRPAFAVYTTSYDEDTVHYVKKHFRSTSQPDYVIDDSKTKAYFTALTKPFKKMTIGANLKEVQTTKVDQAKRFNFQPKDVIAYDIEDWDSTPSSEINNVAGSVKKGAQIVHSAGYRYGVTPDGNMIMSKYKEIDWKNVDFLGVQIQRFSGDEAKAVEWSKKISEHVKSKNPNTEVFIQLSLRQASNCYDWRSTPNMKKGCAHDSEYAMKNLEKTISEVAKLKTVDGFIVTYMPKDETASPTNPCPSKICNAKNLDRILTYIENLN